MLLYFNVFSHTDRCVVLLLLLLLHQTLAAVEYLLSPSPIYLHIYGIGKVLELSYNALQTLQSHTSTQPTNDSILYSTLSLAAYHKNKSHCHRFVASSTSFTKISASKLHGRLCGFVCMYYTIRVLVTSQVATN